MYVRTSVPKNSSGGGSPAPKSPNVILVMTKDIQNFPALAHGNVVMSEDLVLKTEAKSIQVYATPSTIERSDSSEGEDDAAGFVSTLKFEHPGDTPELNNLLEYGINEDWVALTKECGDNLGTRIQGTPCNPLKLQTEGLDSKEGKKQTLTFKQAMRSKFKMRHYMGEIPAVAPDPTPEAGGEADEDDGL